MSHTSDRLRRACALFGIRPTRGRPRRDLLEAETVAAHLDSALRPGQIALILGPSGSGKSTIARALARQLGRRAIIASSRTPRPSRAPIIDLFASPLTGALSHLSRAGLAEAALLARRADELSDGQRARLSIALAMERAERLAAPTLILDEFGSTLDRPTAAALSRTVRRWALSASARLVCITAHDDLLEFLAPDALIYKPLAGSPTLRWRRKENAA